MSGTRRIGLQRIRPYICSQCRTKQQQSLLLGRRFSNGKTARSQTQRPSTVLGVLEERGYVEQLAGDRDVFNNILHRKKLGFYAGIDPTAPSLHLGHLLPFMVIFWLYRYGHNVVSLVGGATARVGDPSGRLTSRTATTEAAMNNNVESMQAQVQQLWKNVDEYGGSHDWEASQLGSRKVLNNASWLQDLGILQFLKLMGNGARIGTMLGRDTVKNKMEKGDGMSFAEFTYPLLQGWDWWHMYQDLKVQVQIGGADQYGNIVAGMDAVKYILQAETGISDSKWWLTGGNKLRTETSPFGLTVPLLTTSSGEKFGKSAGNAVWLDRTMTSPFDLYGFLLRSSDADVQRYLSLFTFLSLDAINDIMHQHNDNPSHRHAQHTLATEVLELVHGRTEAERTRAEHQKLRAPTLASLLQSEPAVNDKHDTAVTESASAHKERIKLPQSLIVNNSIARVLYHAGLAKTKSEAVRLVTSGGVYVAQNALADTATAETGSSADDGGQLNFVAVQKTAVVDSSMLVNGLLVLRLGKWKVRLVEVMDDDDEFEKLGLSVPGLEEGKIERGRR